MMHERWVRSGDLGVTRLLWVFAGLSVVFVTTLAMAPLKGHITEWREAQGRYNDLARQRGTAPLPVGIQQIWKPELDVTDRCTSCHVAAAGGEAAGDEKLFAAHPAVPHDPGDFGCTVCHGGQGRATTAHAAHGDVHGWSQPLLQRRYAGAGCGTCHTGLAVSTVGQVAKGEALVRQLDCLGCHRIDGAGRGTGPDLSAIGLKGTPKGWLASHQKRAASGDAPAWMKEYVSITDDDRDALDRYLASLTGTADLRRGKALANSLGCRGCHKIRGVGGTEGPDLTREGLVDPGTRDFSGVRGAHTTAGWLFEHFLSPGRVVPGSQMVDQSLTLEQAETLTLYMLSLRGSNVDDKTFWPRDRLRSERLGEREVPPDGEAVFAAYCSGCHGAQGQGRRYANIGVVFPAVGSADFLSTASDDLIRATIAKGRPGRKMPAWGEMEGGLTAEEIDAVAGWLRSRAPATDASGDIPLPAGDTVRGAQLFATVCQGCHGPNGEGAEAPSLTNSVLLATATDQFLAKTVLRGRAGTQMRAFGRPQPGFPTLDSIQAADIIAWLRAQGGARPSAPKGN